MTDPCVVVYGANGATGARFVEVAAQAGTRPIVAGRNREALERVAAPHGLEVRVGTLDPAQLDRVLEGAAVVVSCVAPYTTRGLPVVEAALRQGAHHVDCTGEPRYVARLIESYDEPARRAGAVVVPAAGIGLCANLVARAAARGVESVERLRVDYRVRGMRPSWGTARSTVQLLAGGSPVADRGQVRFVAPGSRIVRRPGGLGVLFPLTDVLTFQRQWPGARIESYIGSHAAPLLAPALAAAGLLCRRRWVAGAVDRAAARPHRPATKPPKGHFTVTVTAEGGGRRATAVARVPDIYEVTSQAAFDLTRTLLERDAEPGFRASGEVVGEPAEVAARIGIELGVAYR